MNVLYIIGASAPPVRQLGEACQLAIEYGWRPHVILTPTAAEWVDLDPIRAITGAPVRVGPRRPDEQDPFPKADAVLAAPLTFNTINKWAAGISDTLALGLLNELLIDGPAITVAPCAKRVLRGHPAYAESIERLNSAGAQFLDQDEVIVNGEDGLATFDWQTVIESLGGNPDRR
jgi:phosphopantothenoylcysteine synthetase/decarboxylase